MGKKKNGDWGDGVDVKWDTGDTGDGAMPQGWQGDTGVGSDREAGPRGAEGITWVTGDRGWRWEIFGEGSMEEKRPEKEKKD